MSEMKTKERSPSFPFISLEEAIKRLKAFDQTFGRHPAPAAKAGLAWGMKESSSQAYQTLAALKSFGLLQYEGSGTERKASHTDNARKYLRAQQESIKLQVLREIATKPTQIQKFWTDWGADRPPDPVCLDDLVLKHAFTDSAARKFLEVYDETIAFAGLTGLADTTEDEVEKTASEQDIRESALRVGDGVNWESGGQIQWKYPWEIIDIQSDEKGDEYLQVRGKVGEEAGQEGWIPKSEAIRQEAETDGGAKVAREFSPPSPSKGSRDRWTDSNKEGMREDKASLDEGEVVLIWPDKLSPDSVADFEYWINGIVRRAKRRAGLKEDERSE